MTSTVYIAKNVYGGDGLGRLGDGRVVFVAGAFAGENVKAEIFEEHKNFVRARLVEVADASEDRTGEGEPPIPGMVYANVSQTAETRMKRDQLAEFFMRARIAVPGGIGVSPAGGEGGYRNKVVYHFAKQGGRWAIGYRREPDHVIVDIEHDPLATGEIDAKLPEVRNGVLALLTQGPAQIRRDVERKGCVTVRWTAKNGVKWWVGDAPAGLTLRETTLGTQFEVPAGGFYQVNPQVGDALVASVRDGYGKIRDEAPTVIDLYCGVGVFGICLRPRKLIGVESGRQAVESAKRNAAAAGIDGWFFAEQVGRSLRKIPAGGKTCVIVDPPRGGLEPNVPKFLAGSGAPRIFYASCDPATLIRDLRTICLAYDVEKVEMFNMFPRTARFETLVSLKRR